MRISFSIDISQKPEEVFPWIAEPEKALLWQKGVKKGEIIQERPEKIGTTFREVMEEDGNHLEMSGVITGYIHNQLIAFHLKSKIHKVDVRYSIVGNPEKSTITMESRIYWKFPMNVLSIIIGRKIQEKILRQVEAEFLELKRLCEEEQVM
jgi:hypothetical protein